MRLSSQHFVVSKGVSVSVSAAGGAAFPIGVAIAIVAFHPGL